MMGETSVNISVNLPRSVATFDLNNDTLNDDKENQEDERRMALSELILDKKKVDNPENMNSTKTSGISDTNIDELFSNTSNTIPAQMGDVKNMSPVDIENSKSNNTDVNQIVDADSGASLDHQISSNCGHDYDTTINVTESGIPLRLKHILDSDSEDEQDLRALFKFGTGNKAEKEIEGGEESCMSMKNKDCDTAVSPKPELKSSNSTDKAMKNISSLEPKKINALIDTDSEVDYTSASDDESGKSLNANQAQSMQAKGNPKIKRTGSIRTAKEEAMREIHSEAQRMLRESEVSLPYHRPRQRTLQEFLNRRKNLPILSTALTTAARVKISGEFVGKALEQKEKEAELFYKSSSDSEREEDYNPEQAAVENTTRNICIAETQKVTKNEVKNCANGEIIDQGDKALGIPRKLFGSENNGEFNERAPPIDKDNFDEKLKHENQNFKQRKKEFKQGLKIVSVPRKLFGMGNGEFSQMDKIYGSKQINEEQKIHNNVDECKDNCVADIGKHLISNNLSKLPESGNTNEFVNGQNAIDELKLKFSEKPYELINDKLSSQNLNSLNIGTNEFQPLTETPFINNEEISKLNEKRKSDLEVNIESNSLVNKTNRSNRSDLSSLEYEQPLPVHDNASSSSEDFVNGSKTIGHVYGLPLPEFHQDKIKETNTRNLADIMRLTPKLQGSPDMLIELSPPKVGINRLMSRFLKHSVAIKNTDSNAEVVAIRTEQTASGLKIINEVLPYKIQHNEKNDNPELSKPGAKLARLKEDLQQQMVIQRIKEWEYKELEMKTENDDDVYKSELSDCGIEDEDGDDEAEDLSDYEESEPEENDLSITKAKKKYKNPFADEEAIDSEDDVEEKAEDEDDVSCEEHQTEQDVDDVEDMEAVDTEQCEESDNEANWNNKPRNLKRIMKAFKDDDSSDSEVEGLVQSRPEGSDLNKSSHSRNFARTKTDVDMFPINNNSDDDWLNGTESDLPAYQPRLDDRSQVCATPSILNNSLSIVSPITQLTALNAGSDSANATLSSVQTPLQSISTLSVENTPVEEGRHRASGTQKYDKLQSKLFDDIKGTPEDTELLGLCSGQFSGISDNNELASLMHTSRHIDVSEAELLDLCSGTFATQPVDIEKLEVWSSKNIQTQNEKVPNVLKPAHNGSLLSLKGVLEKQSQKTNMTSPSKLKMVFSSDEEESPHTSRMNNVKNFKKKIKKLKLSDDEEENDNLSLSDLDGQDDGEDDGAATFVDYDSEENEILVPKKDIRKVAANFLDEEAELSESEWGSADEDERDLDKLDLEEGDMENIDHDQVKKQLEKIHMKQILDADQREVRLLQEIFLDDGELHSEGTSRQRKFKWKNIDKLGEDSKDPLQSGAEEEGVSVDLSEAESELVWRKERMDREQFLQQQRIKQAAEDIEEETASSQLFQLGIRALKKNKSNKVPVKDSSIDDGKSRVSVARHTVADLFASPEHVTKTFALQTAIHRSSFLARGEESLAKLSVITKQNNDQVIVRPKNSRNFVFAQLSPMISATDDNETLSSDHKNTRAEGEKSRKRKPKFSMTPLASKKPKKDYKEINRHKLFN